MSTEEPSEFFAPTVERGYSPFWPLAIILAGLIGWSAYQAFSSFSQAATLSNAFRDAQPTITAAEGARSRLYALAQDLVQTGAKDPAAAQIVKENNIQLKSNPNASAPAPASAPPPDH